MSQKNEHDDTMVYDADTQENTDKNLHDQSEAIPAQATPKKIGFLGRRGTAPIKTTSMHAEGTEYSELGAPTSSAKAPMHQAGSIDQPHNAENASANTPQEPKAGIAVKVFTGMSAVGPISLLFLLTVHSLASILLPSVYFPQEITTLTAYEAMKNSGQWLLGDPALGISFPAYYWFMSLIDLLPIPRELLLPIISSLTALIALLGTYFLGMSAKLGKDISFAAGLILLASPLFMLASHMISPHMFTMGLTCFALAFLIKGWTANSAVISFILGFSCTALATLSGGIVPLCIILLSNVALILWRTTFRRAHQLDAVIGFAVLVLLLSLWFVAIILTGGQQAGYMKGLVDSMIMPFMPPYWPLKPTWHSALSIIAIGFLPWILAPFMVSWFTVLKNAWTNLKASRKEHSGVAWLYISTTVGIALYILCAFQDHFAALTLLPLLALLLAKCICNFQAVSSKIFTIGIVLCCLIIGVASTVLSIGAAAPWWEPFISTEQGAAIRLIKGLPLVSAVLLIGAAILIKFTNAAFSRGTLLVVSLMALILVQPMTMIVAPSLNGTCAIQHPQGTGIFVLPYGLGAHPAIMHPIDSIPVAPLPQTEEKTLESPSDTAPEIQTQEHSAPQEGTTKIQEPAETIETLDKEIVPSDNDAENTPNVPQETQEQREEPAQSL